MKTLRSKIFLSALACLCRLQAAAQPGEDPATAYSYTLIAYDSTQITGCPNSYNLGTTTTAATPSAITGSMNNDVWFKFTALATVVKAKVCSPTTFDAGMELWNANAGGTNITTRKDSVNAFGSGVKEYKCMSGLVTGNVYFLRVGRVSGSGAGTFGISMEHNKASVNPGAVPPACYLYTNTLTRYWIPPAIATSTQWQFYQGGTLIATITGGASISLGGVSGLCLGQSYQVYVQVSCADTECGVVWWGTSTAYTITMCACLPVTIQTPACGATISLSTVMNATYQGSGVEYQWRFITNNGTVELCTAWSQDLGVFTPFGYGPWASCLRYNKLYSVQVRARKAPCIDATCWSTACNYITPPMPLSIVTLPGINCGQYMSLNDGFITASTYLGADQWRFKFSPIDPCSCNAVAPAVTTPWMNTYVVIPVEYLTEGVIYSVQAQWRILPETCIGCNGNVLINGQQTDWAPYCCMFGINSGNVPPDGSSVTAGCLTGGDGASMAEPDVQQEQVQKINAFRQGGALLVELEAGMPPGVAQLMIYDMQGRIVHRSPINNSDGMQLWYVDEAARFPAGIYIITIMAGEQVYTTRCYLSGE